MKNWKWLAILVLLLVVLSESMNAYLEDSDEISNLMRIGINTIQAKEEFETPSPGKITRKSPRAQNTGSVKCHVRAWICLSDHRAAKYIEYYTNGVKGILGENWEEGEDGYYYYTPVLSSGETTAPIFTDIQMLETLPPKLADITIDIYFESVQAEGAKAAQEAFEKIK